MWWWPALATAAWFAAGPAAAVTIAVLDTGIDFNDPALASHIASGGRDFHASDLDPSDEDPDRHGTLVARVAIGVSPSSLILPVRVLGADGEGSNFNISRGLAYVATTSARVVNLSLGDPESSYDPGVGAALQTAARANKVIVMAAGNEGLDQPTFPANLADELAGTAIAVGATNGAGVIAAYSNRAGDTMRYFLVASGVDPATGAQGTSFSTPRVAGAAAEVLAQNPSLTNAQVVSILLDSADDRGAPGPDTIYGRGELNVERARQASGTVTVPGSSSGGGSSVGAGALVLGAGIAAALAMRSRTLPKTLVLDSYGRPYSLELDTLLEAADHRPTLAARLAGQAGDTGQLALETGDRSGLSLWYARDAHEAYGLWPEDAAGAGAAPARWALALNTAPAAGVELSAGLNADPRASFGALGARSDDSPLAAGLAGVPVGDSYLGFAATGHSALAAWHAGPGTQLALGIVAMDEDTPHGLRSEALIGEARAVPAENLTVALSLSQLTEHGSLLGGSAGGPLGVERASTVSGGLSARWQVSNRLVLGANYALGVTQVDAAAHSLLGEVSPLTSHTWGAGLVAGDTFQPGDRLGLAVSRPLRVTGGQARLRVPYAKEYDGTIRFHDEAVALSAPGAELDLEASYHRPLGRHAALSAWLQYRAQPDHDPDRTATVSALGAVRWSF